MECVSEGNFETWDPGDFLKTKKNLIYLELFGLRRLVTVGGGGYRVGSYVFGDPFCSVTVTLHE